MLIVLVKIDWLECCNQMRVNNKFIRYHIFSINLIFFALFSIFICRNDSCLVNFITISIFFSSFLIAMQRNLINGMEKCIDLVQFVFFSCGQHCRIAKSGWGVFFWVVRCDDEPMIKIDRIWWCSLTEVKPFKCDLYYKIINKFTSE